MNFLAPLLGSSIRHIFSAAGGFLVAKGITTPEVAQSAATSMSEITLGGIAFLAGFIPSILKAVAKK